MAATAAVSARKRRVASDSRCKCAVPLCIAASSVSENPPSGPIMTAAEPAPVLCGAPSMSARKSMSKSEANRAINSSTLSAACNIGNVARRHCFTAASILALSRSVAAVLRWERSHISGKKVGYAKFRSLFHGKFHSLAAIQYTECQSNAPSCLAKPR